MRKDYFFIGLGTRLIMAAIFILVNQQSHYNDASEIIYYAFQEIFQGNNPYSSIYTLHWGESTFSQPFNYGPFMLLLYLPAMLIPIWYNSLWIGMTIVINVYCYGIAELLTKWGSRDNKWQQNALVDTSEKDPRQNVLLYYGGLFFWMIPAGTTCITVFIYAPIFILLLAFHYLDRPILTGLFIALGSFTYQIILLMAPIFGIYHLKRSWRDFGKFLLGIVPVLFVVLFFEFWNSGGLLYSLIGYNVMMPYNKCPTCNNGFDAWSIFSIPRLAYNFSNGMIQIGPLMRIIFAILLVLICAVYLFTHYFDNFQAKFLMKYCIWAVIGFTLTTNFGQAHYLLFLYPLLFYTIQSAHPDFRKEDPIGPGIDTWQDFERYTREHGKYPA